MHDEIAAAGTPARKVGPRGAVFAAAAVDAVGSGMFLPMAVLFQIRVVGLSASTAGAVTAVATLVSLAVPALVGALVDRAGARWMVIAAFAVQGIGTVGLLAAHGTVAALAATVAAAAGQRAFWASLFTLLADVAGQAAEGQVFATAGMVQSAGATVGALAAGPLMAVGSVASYRLVVALNAVSFLGGALVVLFGVPPQRPVRAASAAATGFRRVLADRGFLTLMAAYTSITFTVALCTVVAPVFVIDVLHLPGWQPSLLLGSVTLAVATLRGRVVHLLRRRSRVTVLGWAVLANGVWLAGMAVVVVLPRALQPWFLAAVMVPYIAAQLVHGPVCAALVHALAPAELRGRYQATFQYAFGLSNVAGPAVVGLLTVAPVLPWLAGLVGAAVAVVLLRRLGADLPRTVQYRPDAGVGDGPPAPVADRSGHRS